MVTLFCYGKNTLRFVLYYYNYNVPYIFRLFYSRFIVRLLQIIFKVVHLISIIGNQGTLTKSIEQIITNIEILYHLLYLIFCILGIFMHPFFYSVLVSITGHLFLHSAFHTTCDADYNVIISFSSSMWFIARRLCSM